MAWRREPKVEIDISAEKVAELKQLLEDLDKGLKQMAERSKELRRLIVDLNRAASRAEAAARLPHPRRN